MSQRFPARWQAAALLLCMIFLAACTRTASIAPFIDETPNGPRVFIDRVQITEGTGLYMAGRSTLEDGGCIQTNLMENQKAVGWWPRDVCIQADAGQWEMLVSLGRGGAPETLDPQASYEMQAWSQKQPDSTLTRFPFDMNVPGQP